MTDIDQLAEAIACCEREKRENERLRGALTEAIAEMESMVAYVRYDRRVPVADDQSDTALTSEQGPGSNDSVVAD